MYSTDDIRTILGSGAPSFGKKNEPKNATSIVARAMCNVFPPFASLNLGRTRARGSVPHSKTGFRKCCVGADTTNDYTAVNGCREAENR